MVVARCSAGLPGVEAANGCGMLPYMCPVRGDSTLQTAVLDELAEAEHYRDWLIALAAPWVGDDLIEVGSGTGEYVPGWLGLGDTIRVTATEADEARLDGLRSRFGGEPRVSVKELLLPTDAAGSHTAAVAFNVIEHIVDDVGALRSMRDLVAPDGKVIVFVPAFEVAMSRFDREIGHVRRYRARTLRASIEAAGLEVDELHYVNSVGLLAWIVGMRLLGRRPTSGKALDLWDEHIIRRLRRIEERRRPPFGQSLFAVAHRRS